VLFTASGTYFDESQSSVDVQWLRTGEVKTLARPGWCGRYAPTGHLLYVKNGTLYAAPMDLRRMELTGPLVQVVENVDDGFAIDSSQSGTLVYVPDKSSKQMLVWLDSAGHTEPLRTAAAKYFWTTCRLSPNGKRLAASIMQDGNADLWVYELERDTLTRLTSTPSNDSSPVWAPDGQHIAFSSTMHGGAENIYWVRADGTGNMVRLTESKNTQFPCSLSPDGKRLAFQELNPRTNWDLWTLPLEEVESDHPKIRKPEPFLVTPSNEWFPMISPDGKWLAYNSNEAGRLEVQVRGFPRPEGKWQVSTAGGGFPVWSRTAAELFYRDDEVVMVTNYRAVGEAFLAAKPRVWVEKENLGGFGFDLASDGKRFVVVQEAESKEKGPCHLTVLLNFFDELRRRAPAGGR
jgi:serine/threonine-protein kinase